MPIVSDVINTIGGIVVMVSDQQKSLEFFTKKLDFEEKENQDFGAYKWIEVRPKNSDVPISLVDPDKINVSPEVKEKLKMKIGIDTGIWFYAKDINAVYQRLDSHGVEITEPKKQPWGAIMSEFYDPDKNKYSLLENTELIF